MSKVALVIGLATTLSFPAFAEDQMLGGTYRLVSSTRKLLETGQVVDTFGKHPSGYINYGKDGRFLVLIV
jgi:Lipocalin-like domain